MDKRTKRILDGENDPRILRALLSEALEHIERQKGIIQKIELERLEKAQSEFALEERVKLLRRALFGKSSEKRADATDRPRDKSQTEASLFSQAAMPAPVNRDEAQKGKAKGRDLEDVIIDIEIADDELIAEGKLRGLEDLKASDWIKTGLFDESVKIQIIERRYVRERHRKHKYKLRKELCPVEKEVIITANSRAELLPGMNYTTEFVAAVVADKYISHMPLERQTREMESLGLLGMRNSTLSRLSGLAAAALEPLQEKILKEDLITSNLALHLDETPWKIQNKNEKDGYMWVMSNRFGSYYFYRPTRSAAVITEKLLGYSGPVVTDGYKSYDDVLDKAQIPHGYELT
jgi:transposase